MESKPERALGVGFQELVFKGRSACTAEAGGGIGGGISSKPGTTGRRNDEGEVREEAGQHQR